MNYNDYYLKFASETEFDTAFVDAGYKQTWDAELDEEGNEIEPGGYSYYIENGAVDVIGTIFAPTGNMLQTTEEDGSTYEFEETAPVEGFHVNVRLREGVELATEVQEFVLSPAPSTPARIFA